MRGHYGVIELRELAKKLLKHELGHWLSAKELDFGVGDIEITIRCTGPNSYQPLGSTMIYPPCESLTNLEQVETYLISRITVLVSGVISEFYKNGRLEVEKANSALDFSADTDNIKIKELLSIARPIRFNGDYDLEDFSGQLTTIYSECWGKSEAIIKRQVELIKYLSDELSKIIIMSNTNYTIKASEINKLIQEHEEVSA